MSQFDQQTLNLLVNDPPTGRKQLVVLWFSSRGFWVKLTQYCILNQTVSRWERGIQHSPWDNKHNWNKLNNLSSTALRFQLIPSSLTRWSNCFFPMHHRLVTSSVFGNLICCQAEHWDYPGWRSHRPTSTDSSFLQKHLKSKYNNKKEPVRADCPNFPSPLRLCSQFWEYF